MKHLKILALLLGVVFAPTLSQSAWAQDKAPQATTSKDPAINVDILKLQLIPLTKAELQVETAAWMQLVQENAQNYYKAEIKARGQQGEARQSALDEVNKLRDARTRIVDRANVVLAAFQTKGGDIVEHEKYIAAISGVQIDPKDVDALVATAKGWAMSPEGGLRWIRNIIFFFLTLLFFKILSWLVGRTVYKLVSSSKNVSELLRDFFVNAASKTVSLIGLVMALSMLEINVGPFVAGIGAVGFVVAFALQGTLSNFAAGVMILVYRPYDLKDFVEVAGVTGVVSSMNLVSTTLLTGDNQLVVVPNSSIWGGIIKNVTGKDTRRVDLTFGIGYDDDMGEAQAILEELVNNHPLVLKDPTPVVKVHELADSSVNYVVRPWCKTSDYWAVYWDLTRQCKERFDAAKISIPYPQTDVHVHQVQADPSPSIISPNAAPTPPPAPPAAPASSPTPETP